MLIIMHIVQKLLFLTSVFLSLRTSISWIIFSSHSWCNGYF